MHIVLEPFLNHSSYGVCVCVSVVKVIPGTYYGTLEWLGFEN